MTVSKSELEADVVKSMLGDKTGEAAKQTEKVVTEKKIEKKIDEISEIVDEEVEVDLDGGVKSKMPKSQAAKVIANRTAKHQELKTLKDKVAQIEARDAKIAADAKAAEEASDTDKKIASGDVKSVIQANNLKWETQIASERSKLTKLGDNLVGSELKGRLATMANLNLSESSHQTIVNDTLGILKHQVKYNFDTASLEVVDSAGTVMTDSDTGESLSIDKFMTKFLADRPYIVQKKIATKINTGDVDKKAITKRASWDDIASAMIKRK